MYCSFETQYSLISELFEGDMDDNRRYHRDRWLASLETVTK